jgi:hypothetical protein
MDEWSQMRDIRSKRVEMYILTISQW